MAFAYILRCADGSYDVGSTIDLEERLRQHASGLGARYTSTRLPVKLVWSQEFDRLTEADGWERRLHGWSRAKKQMLVEGRWDDLSGYSRRSRSVE